jgi:hypothetical protein
MVYEYQRELNRILARKTLQNDSTLHRTEASVTDTLRVSGFPVQDGLSMVYFARRVARSNEAITLPAVSMGKVGEVEFFTEREEESIEIDALPRRIPTVKMKGKLRLEGIFGLKGDFVGWFSDDEASVPIAARLKVLLGSIRLELKGWRRGNWQPPQVE